MKIKSLFIALISLVIIACGEASTVEAPFHNNIDTSATEVATKYDLGICTSKNEGRSVWAKKESKRYNCKSNKWVVVNDTTDVANTPDTSEVFDASKVSYGSLEDSRDGHKYKTVKIGKQVWMAENLNYMNDSIFSACTPEEFGGCKKYGRAYIWHSAMELARVSENNLTTPSELEEYIHSPHQGVCPEGWHIPNDAEWNALMDYVESHNGKEFAGTSLRTSDWDKMDGLPQGTNRFGFSAIQAADGWISKTSRIDFKKYFNQSISETNPQKIKPVVSIRLSEKINDAGEREKYIGTQASFCSISGNIWQLSTDEFWNISDKSDKIYSYQTCYVRCIKD